MARCTSSGGVGNDRVTIHRNTDGTITVKLGSNDQGASGGGSDGGSDDDALQFTFAAGSVSQIVVHTCEGDDYVRIGGSGSDSDSDGGSDESSDGGSDGESDPGTEITIPTLIQGGAGNDHLVGGAGIDDIDGGSGDDRIDGTRWR